MENLPIQITASQAIQRALRGLYQWCSIFREHGKRFNVKSTQLKIALVRLFVLLTHDEIRDKISQRKVCSSPLLCEESAWRCDLETWLSDYWLQLLRRKRRRRPHIGCVFPPVAQCGTERSTELCLVMQQSGEGRHMSRVSDYILCAWPCSTPPPPPPSPSISTQLI